MPLPFEDAASKSNDSSLPTHTKSRLESSQPFATSHLLGRNPSNKADQVHESRNEIGGANVSSTAAPPRAYSSHRRKYWATRKFYQPNIESMKDHPCQCKSHRTMTSPFAMTSNRLLFPYGGSGPINIHQSSMPGGIDFPPKEPASSKAQHGFC